MKSPRLTESQIVAAQRELDRLGAPCMVAYRRKPGGRGFKLAGPMSSFRDALVATEGAPKGCAEVLVHLRHDRFGHALIWTSLAPDKVIRLPGERREPTHPVPSEAELADAIHDAARAAFGRLFAERPGERFYYCTMTTSGSAGRPAISAWSQEALEARASTPSDREMLAWSYSDSPYWCYGDEHFRRVEELFLRRPELDCWDSEQSQGEYDLRLRAMETAMARLEREGLFGRGAERLGTVVAVEVMPPDWTNRARVARLNPPEAIRYWLEHVAERDPDEPGA